MPNENESLIVKTRMLAGSLRMYKETQDIAERIAVEYRKENPTSSLGEMSLASGAVYLAGLLKNERRTLREVSGIVGGGVSESTVSKAFKKILNSSYVKKQYGEPEERRHARALSDVKESVEHLERGLEELRRLDYDTGKHDDLLEQMRKVGEPSRRKK